MKENNDGIISGKYESKSETHQKPFASASDEGISKYGDSNMVKNFSVKTSKTVKELEESNFECRNHNAIVNNNLTKTESELLSIRVIKKNLVYIVGLSPKMTEEMLRRHNFFGQYGKINKVIVNVLKNNSACAYITYFRGEDAENAIRYVDESVYEGRTIRCTFGTTKYCSFFIKNIPCQNHLGNVQGANGTSECMYLHEFKPHQDILTKEELLKSKLHTFKILNQGKEVLGAKMASFRFIEELVQYKKSIDFKKPSKIHFEPYDVLKNKINNKNT
ncbi:CNOT4 [Ecytonucleospora hepatopenaei]|uniref:CNOT4 n=1 Tax=Ecytonucleospora hepatopenaei TaxID=646526 RepID=A0A1W0E840_9MICR|nr:CNOT4 [Ecytonucleospora hepatopenaei]